ncbi:hypothetical protein ACOMHN_000024 [Nucella lapillus]
MGNPSQTTPPSKCSVCSEALAFEACLPACPKKLPGRWMISQMERVSVEHPWTGERLRQGQGRRGSGAGWVLVPP